MQALADTIRRFNPWRRPPVAAPEPDDDPVELPTLRTNPNTLEQRVNHARTALQANDTPETRDAYRDAVALLQYRRLLALSASFEKTAIEVRGTGRELSARLIEEGHALARLSADYWRRPAPDTDTALRWSSAFAEKIGTRSDEACEALEQRANELAQLARNHKGRARALAAAIENTRAEQIETAGTPVASDRVMTLIRPQEVDET